MNLDVLVPDEEEGTKAYKGRFHCMENFWDVGVSNAPLNQRAWVYQERLLSPRVLHLGSNQAFWERFGSVRTPKLVKLSHVAFQQRYRVCFKIETSHVLLSTIFNEHPEIRSPERWSEQDKLETEAKMLELWWQVVRTYNRGRLTKYEDKLIAMAGIAKEMQVFLKDK